ncbi:MAG: hypothetical protein QM621_11040 [Aeromicrobium sp.]|uniref:hypothetical protein n=1 Tax=Aeromicrobium sp. TaxID=1871063 RepID=UPI0039E68454
MAVVLVLIAVGVFAYATQSRGDARVEVTGVVDEAVSTSDETRTSLEAALTELGERNTGVQTLLDSTEGKVVDEAPRTALAEVLTRSKKLVVSEIPQYESDARRLLAEITAMNAEFDSVRPMLDATHQAWNDEQTRIAEEAARQQSSSNSGGQGYHNNSGNPGNGGNAGGSPGGAGGGSSEPAPPPPFVGPPPAPPQGNCPDGYFENSVHDCLRVG